MNVDTETTTALETLGCAYCRHGETEHRRSPGGKLRLCRRRVRVGPFDIKLCGCRAFREPAVPA